MTRPTAFLTSLVSLTFCTLVSFGSLPPAQAFTITDTLPLNLTGKEWCRSDPKFFKPIKVKAMDGMTFSLTRDVLGTNDMTDVQVTINTQGVNATIDAIVLNGRSLKANKSGSIAQLALSGRDPNNPDRFLTIRGQATFDKTAKLTKVTGTYVYQILSNSAGVQDVDCFGSGTFGTQKLPSSGGGGTGGGTLTIANAPASVNGKFVTSYTSVDTSFGLVTWTELTLSSAHTEIVDIFIDPFSGMLVHVGFQMVDGDVGTFWSCENFIPPGCRGVSLDRTAGTVTLVDTDLYLDPIGRAEPPITLNGTLKFTPF